MFLWETIRFIGTDIVASVLRYPVWWYTGGFLRIIEMIVRELKGFTHSLNLKILIQSLTKPMFQQTDIFGRFISFFMRLVQLTFFFVLTFFYTLLLVVLGVLWLVAPLFVIYNIVFHLGIFPVLSSNYFLL